MNPPDGGGWHAAPDVLERYAAGAHPPLVSAPVAASVEAHLLTCAACRGQLARLITPVPLRTTWERIEVAVTTPAPSLVQRGLQRLGLPEREALLVDAAPALRSSWLLGVLLSLVLVALAVRPDGALDSLVFLVLAPLIPVGAVAVSFNRELDPLWETTAATPYPRLRLVLLRSLAVAVSAVPATFLAAPLMSGPPWLAALWLVPAAACTATALAVSTWVDMNSATIGVAAVWTALVVVVAGPGFHEPLLVLAGPMLASYLLVALAASGLCWLRHDHLLTSWRPS